MKVLNEILTAAGGSLHTSFNLLWSKISPILLPLVLIVVFLSVGLWIVNFISDKFGAVVKKVKIDNLLDRVIAPVLQFTGTKLNLSSIIIESVRWFLIATVLVATLELAHLQSVINFFNQALAYLPSIFASALIIIVGSLIANLAAFIVGTVTKSNFATTAKVAVNALAFIAALSLVITPLIGALSQLIAHLSLSKLQADVLFIGILVLALLASKSTVTKTVENLYKT